MMSNKEFAAYTHTEVDLSPDMADMAMFTVDMGDTAVAIGRDSKGKRILKRANPHLRGKETNLWDITPRRDDMTLPEIKVAVDKQNELDRLARLEGYIKSGYAFDERALTNPQEGKNESDDDPQDEGDGWDKFFSDDVPMKGGRCGTRKRGVRNNESFENFVDSAQ